MSKIALASNASGTGTLTIAAPNTNTDRTLTLPDAAGIVLLGDAVTGRLPAANAPSGSVIQVVEATRTSAMSYTTVFPTYTEFISGSITTTVANSRILVLCNVPAYIAGNSASWSTSQYYRLMQGGVAVQQFEHVGPIDGSQSAYQVELQHLSGPLSVGTYTLAVQGAITSGGATVTIARNLSGQQTKVSLLMMEIAP